MSLVRLLVAFMITIAPAWGASVVPERLDRENILYVDVKSGRVAIQLRPDLAPGHVKRVKRLAREGFYNGVVFHRVLEGFMAQTGDPTGTGEGGSKYPDLKGEFTNTPFVEGTIGAARTRDPNSANSQFFICLAEASHLNGAYTVWGQVIRGMAHVHRIKRGDRRRNGLVDNPDRMLKVQVAADAKDHSVLDGPVSPEPGGSPRGSFD